MQLFSKTSRSRLGPRRNAEPAYDYYNESARSAVNDLREMVEGWFSQYPQAGQRDLKGRFSSPQDWQHHGAFFELYCHELLLGMGFDVLVHPSPGEAEGRRPDFLVSRDRVDLFYLECTTTSGSREEQNRQRLMDEVYDTLDTISSPEFFLILDVEGAPASPVPGRRLAVKVESWLKDQEWKVLRRLVEMGADEDLPVLYWACEGWKVSITPWPKPIDKVGKEGLRPVGAVIPEIAIVEEQIPIRKAISKKGRKYNALELPFVVAVNILGEHADNEDIANALFGDSCIEVSNTGAGSERHRDSRRRNGAWLGPRGWQYTRISAAMFTVGLSPWGAARVHPALWHHPHACRPLDRSLWPLAQLVPDSGTGTYLARGDGDPSRFLRTPNPWPPIRMG